MKKIIEVVLKILDDLKKAELSVDEKRAALKAALEIQAVDDDSA